MALEAKNYRNNEAGEVGGSGAPKLVSASRTHLICTDKAACCPPSVNHRHHLPIVDYIQLYENKRTEEENEKIKERFVGTVQSPIEPRGYGVGRREKEEEEEE